MMLFGVKLDVIEEEIKQYERALLNILLFDRTSRKNIIWATDSYEYLGKDYQAGCVILPRLITGDNTMLIQPRIAKTLAAQDSRTHDIAEVFTPSWILLAIAALVFLYFSPMTRNLYVYSKIQFRSDNPITEQEKREFTELFEGNYLYQNEDGKYYVADLDSGLELSLSDLQDSAPEELDLSIDVSGNYALIEIKDLNSNDRITISFFKASLLERVKFVSRYYYW